MMNINDPIKNQTHDPSACSTVPQPAVPLHTPITFFFSFICHINLKFVEHSKLFFH